MKPTPSKLLGVCAWLADRFGLNVTGLRIICVVAVIFGVGSPLILYLVLYLLKPRGY